MTADRQALIREALEIGLDFARVASDEAQSLYGSYPKDGLGRRATKAALDVKTVEAAIDALAAPRDAAPAQGTPYTTLSEANERIYRLEKVLAARDAAPAQPPTGWRLVPVEPTPEMLNAVIQPEDCEVYGLHAVNAQLRAEYRAMLDAAPPAAQPPAGWRLVPVEPTQDMVDAGTDEYWATPHDKVHVGNPSPVVTYYRAMLAAAPPATPQEPDARVAEMEAQLRHLVDDLTHRPNPDHPTRRYIKPGAGLMFSNMVNAVERLLAAPPATPQEPQ